MTAWDIEVGEAELADAQADARARMTSTCTIRRAGTNTIDANGFQADGWDVTYADLPCRLSVPRGSVAPARTVRVGDVEVQTASRVLHLPAGTDLRDNDYVEITSGVATGRAFRLLDTTPADQQTAVRVQVLEVERPEEWT